MMVSFFDRGDEDFEPGTSTSGNSETGDSESRDSETRPPQKDLESADPDLEDVEVEELDPDLETRNAESAKNVTDKVAYNHEWRTPLVSTGYVGRGSLPKDVRDYITYAELKLHTSKYGLRRKGTPHPHDLRFPIRTARPSPRNLPQVPNTSPKLRPRQSFPRNRPFRLHPREAFPQKTQTRALALALSPLFA